MSNVITQNGRPAGVLISPSEYDRLIETKMFMDSIAKGLSDSQNGKVLSTDQLIKELSDKYKFNS